MSDYRDQIAALETGSEVLGDTLDETTQMVAGFDAELRRMRTSLAATNADMGALEKGLSRGLRGAFDGLIFDGMKLSDALGTVAKSMSNSIYNAAMKPVTNHLGGLLAQGLGSILPFANGASFAQGRVQPFAKGGVISSPTYFPMRGGAGLMGEAGAEAILPLSRGPDGKLGVRAAGGSQPTIVMNISTPDAASFNRSRAQIAHSMNRAMARGQRNA